MIQRPQFALALLLIAGLAGCRHKAPGFNIPHGALAPVALEEPTNPPDTAADIASLPAPELPPISVPMLPPAPRRRPAPAPKEEPAATQNAESAPAELAIGTLSSGGDLAPQIQQQAQDMISSILKRIASLSAQTTDAEKRQVRQIRHFLDQAQQALKTGDTEGAKNLATKARLLLDDLEKR